MVPENIKNICRKLILLVPACLACITISCGGKTGTGPIPSIDRGFLDLTSCDLHETASFPLNGKWEFYWEKFITAEDFSKGKAGNPDLMVEVPHLWNNESINGTMLPRFGFATYRLRVKIKKRPENNTTSIKKKSLGIKTETAGSAFRIFINEKKIGGAGQPGRKKELSTPRENPGIFFFVPPGDEFDIIVHVSNFHHRNGGLWTPLILGSAGSVEHTRSTAVALQLFLMGALLIMGFYHLVLFLFNKKEKSHLYFSIVSFILSFRNLQTGERLLMNIFPSMDYTLFMRLAYLTTFIGVPFFTIFIHSMYPSDSKKIYWQTAFAVSGVFIIILLSTPVEIFSFSLPFYESFIIILIIAALLILIIAAIRKREGARIILAGYTIFFFIILMEISSNLHIFIFPAFSPLGFLIFLFFHSFLLSMKFSHFFSMNQKLSRELVSNNENLTKTLNELKHTQGKLLLQEKKAIIGNLSSGLSRIIRNQLRVIPRLSFLKEKISEDDRQYLQYVFDSHDRIISLLDEIDSLTSNREVSYTMKEEPLTAIIKEATAIAQLDNDVRNKQIKIKENYTGTLVCNRNKLLQVLLNLIRNAAQATDDKGSITLRSRLEDTSVIIDVEDNGKGIPADKIESIWEPFFSTKGDAGTGIGLSISKNIMEGHGGTIDVFSDPPGKTVFILTLPRGTSR